MKKSTWLVLTFLAGMIVGCVVMSSLGTDRAQAQPAAGVKWEHKFFSFNVAGGVGGADTGKTLKEIDDGGWEYSGFTPNNGENLPHPLFKRQKK